MTTAAGPAAIYSADPKFFNLEEVEASALTFAGMCSRRAISLSLLPLLLQRLATEKLPAAVYGYYAGGAETESTLRDNRAVYSRYRLMPRIMVNVSKVSLGMTLLGEHEYWVSRTQICT